MLLKVMRKQGIETGGLSMTRSARRPSNPCDRAFQQVVRFDREKTDDVSKVKLLKILKFVRENIKRMDVVILEDYGKGVMQPFLLKEIVRLAKKFKKPVLVDPRKNILSITRA